MALIKLITPACTICEKTSTLELDHRDIAAWKAGALIQDVWPDLTPDVRELLISGTHPECWDSLFHALEDSSEIEFFEAVFNEQED